MNREIVLAANKMVCLRKPGEMPLYSLADRNKQRFQFYELDWVDPGKYMSRII